MSTSNPLSLILFVIFLYIYSKLYSSIIDSRVNTHDSIIAAMLSVIFTLLTIAASCYTLIGKLTSTLFCAAILLLSSAGFFIIFYYAIMWIFEVTASFKLNTVIYSQNYLPYVAFAACIIGWIPYFLYEYPGVMTPDSINQYAQVIGAYEFTNHHSVIHTLIIGFFYNIGISLNNNPHTGIAIYTIFQMTFMAFVAGYVVKTMQKAQLRLSICIVTICFYALIPYNGIYAVTVWKDVLFAGNVTLFAASLLRLLFHNSREKLLPSEYFSTILPYILSGFMICLLRTNGWYAFIISLPFILFAFRNSLRIALPVHAIILILVLFVKYPCMQIYEIKQADFVESVSIPVQQIARVVVSGQSLTDEQIDSLEHFVDTSQLSLVYDATVSDGVKNLIRTTGNGYIENHKKEFLTLWFSIGLQHPKAYFDAYVDQTNGFWYPDISYEVGLADGIYPNEFGLTWQPIINGKFAIKLREILFKFQEIIPIYGLLWSMGMMFWILLIVAAICIRNQQYLNVLPLIPAIAIVLTLCIATPVATEFRYAYSLAYGLPLYIILPFVKTRDY